MRPPSAGFTPPDRRLLAVALCLSVATLRAQTLPSQLPTPVISVTQAIQLPPGVPRIPIYYPPEPPPPGGAIDRIAPLQLPRWSAPPEVAPFVGEPFYTALATQVTEQVLSRPMRERVENYRVRRQRLLTELRAFLKTPSTALSSSFDAELAALETTAEQLRRDLQVDGLEWGNDRVWNVTEPQPNVSNDLQRIRIFQVLRASVSYADGLSPAQRRLLGEFVLRLAHTAEGEDDAAHFPAQTAKASAAVFFLPETAQINLPAPLSPDLLGRVDLFLQEKNALQCEIAATIISNDNQPSNHARRALENLSRQQQKRIDALERQAEELRAGLAPLVPAPPASPLPADIAIRAREFRHDRQALQSQLVARLEDVRRTELNYRPGVELLNWSTNMSPNTFLPAGSYGTPTVPFGTMLRELPTQHTRPMEVLARLQQTTDRFVADTASRQKELEMRKVELVTATAEALYPSKFTGQPPSAESFAKAARALQADEAAERSAASLEQIAVTVRPGLTPAQRRLLFQGVLIDLDLPLPPGIRRPVSHFEAP